MSATKIQNMIIGVLGAGQMGSGIAQVYAQIGCQVRLVDLSQTALDKAMKSIGSSLEKFVKKEKISEEQRKRTLENIHPSSQFGSLEKCDVVIEAVTENVDLKLNIFAQLDQITQPKTILCTNTSSISITKIAAATKRPSQVVGLHFMNPVPVLPLVEIIRGLQTSDETAQFAKQMVEVLGKTWVEAKDMPGFIINRILMPMINEGAYVLQEGIGDVRSIDDAMKLGTNQPMGPLTLADFIGLDTCLAIMKVLYEGFNDSKYRPAPLLVKYVEAGWLGRKTGRGFYKYE